MKLKPTKLTGMFVTVSCDEVEPWILYLDSMQIPFSEVEKGIAALRRLADLLESKQTAGDW